LAGMPDGAEVRESAADLTGGDVIEIDREHPHYLLRKHIWRMYRDLYTGGEQLRLNAQHYLVR
jgi:hypothetical protein